MRDLRIFMICVVLVLAGSRVGDAVADPMSSLRPGITRRVSLGMGGAEANNRSEFSSVSGDGRYVAFHSFASNLVPGDTIFPDVFVEDRTTGTILRASDPPDGAPTTSVSFYPSLSADGHYVAFTSSASLVSTDTNGVWDIFVRDLESGTMQLASVATDGTQGDDHSSFPSVSADGRYVAFHSPATNLVAGDTNDEHDVFVRDLVGGTLERVSVATDGSEGNGGSMYPSISADGRYVAFQSLASNLALPDLNRNVDVFVHDRVTRTTRRVAIGTNGIEPDGGTFNAVISPDGRFVVFDSSATNLVPDDSNGVWDVYLRDLTEDTTERISVGSDGAQGDERSVLGRPASSVSADGRYVVFHSFAGLVPGDTNGHEDVFVRDRATGTTHLASLASEGTQGNGDSTFASITGDGRYVVFHSSASDLVPADHNGRDDVFIREWGRSTAVGGLSTVGEQGQIRVAGWATFPGHVIASADDPRGDGHAAAAPAGGEIVDARLAHRVDLDDLLVRLRLATLPVGLAGRGVVYRVRFEMDGIPYEIRGTRIAGNPASPTETSFTLLRCDGDCREVASLIGTIGSSGPIVEVSVPLSILGASGGTRLRDVEAATALEGDSQFALPLDTVVLGDATLHTWRVELGIAATDAEPGEVVYASEAILANGRFTGTLDASTLAGGTYRVWAKASLADEEALSSIELAVEPDPESSPTPTAIPSGSPSPSPTASPLPESTSVAFTERFATSGQYSDEATFEARLTDSNGDPIAGALLTFGLTGETSEREFEATTIDDGLASVTVRLTERPGAHDLTVHYDGDASRTAASDLPHSSSRVRTPISN